MDIHLEQWEINMILDLLGERPYNETGATIRRILEQVEPTVISCGRCVWFAPVACNPTAEKIHAVLGGNAGAGICRKLTFTPDRPVMTTPDGYCHRAERREADE